MLRDHLLASFVLLLATPQRDWVSHGYLILGFCFHPVICSRRSLSNSTSYIPLKQYQVENSQNVSLSFFFKSIFNENTVGLWNHLIHLSAVGSFRGNNAQPYPTCHSRDGLKIGRGRNGLPLLGMKGINSMMVHKWCLFQTQIMCAIFTDNTLILTPDAFFQLRISLKKMEGRNT